MENSARLPADEPAINYAKPTKKFCRFCELTPRLRRAWPHTQIYHYEWTPRPQVLATFGDFYLHILKYCICLKVNTNHIQTRFLLALCSFWLVCSCNCVRFFFVLNRLLCLFLEYNYYLYRNNAQHIEILCPIYIFYISFVM